MKYTSLFFGLLISLLSFVPCSDVFAISRMQQATVSISKDLSHPSREVQDFCSPFCICSCCNVMSEIPNPISVAQVLLQITTDYQVLEPAQVISLPLSVWQPPKLS
ncbi:DUF6660 family protein [Pedobacter suwonensis]|uniref:DUF6660 family protein n=1 Tax=Pedobacter suwonensis TaxID=332999 RepID=UPI003679D900